MTPLLNLRIVDVIDGRKITDKYTAVRKAAIVPIARGHITL